MEILSLRKEQQVVNIVLTKVKIEDKIEVSIKGINQAVKLQLC